MPIPDHQTGEIVMQATRRRRADSGQIIIVFALALVALLALASLIVDGGNAYAQQRITQNGSDSAAEAGAVVLMRRLANVPGQDGDAVNAAVQAAAATNGLTTIGGVTTVTACYTDLKGIPLDSAGNPVADCSTAAQVGPGLPIPPCAGCPGGTAAGVRAGGRKEFATLIGGIVGFSKFTASAEATAIAGYVTTLAGPVFPITFPVLATGCDGSNNAVQGTSQWPTGVTLSIPLCSNSPGNVGWLDWTPSAQGYPPCESSGTGTNELACSITTPNNPAITTPRWYYITNTGNVNAAPVQTAVDTWNGQSIWLPIFDATCNGTPANLTNPVGRVEDCVDGGNELGGNGSNQWYFLVGFAQFNLQQSFINGGDGGACEAAYYTTDTPGNGGTSCLIGQFPGNPDAVSLGSSVGAGGGSPNEISPPGVQLIR
jgi:hypothetical protein